MKKPYDEIVYENEFIRIRYARDYENALYRILDKSDRLVSDAILYSSIDNITNKDIGKGRRFIKKLDEKSKQGAVRLIDFLSDCGQIRDDIKEVFDMGIHTWDEIAGEYNTNYMCEIGNYIVVFSS